MKLILIFGPQAVGKMTVGHDLEKNNRSGACLVAAPFSFVKRTERLVK
jgi:hypothetical protein